MFEARRPAELRVKRNHSEYLVIRGSDFHVEASQLRTARDREREHVVTRNDSRREMAQCKEPREEQAPLRGAAELGVQRAGGFGAGPGETAWGIGCADICRMSRTKPPSTSGDNAAKPGI